MSRSRRKKDKQVMIQVRRGRKSPRPLHKNFPLNHLAAADYYTQINFVDREIFFMVMEIIIIIDESRRCDRVQFFLASWGFTIYKLDLFFSQFFFLFEQYNLLFQSRYKRFYVNNTQ